MSENKIHPKIDYGHVLRELSVNKQDPCELVRELISNSYDAGASIINLYPYEEESGLIFIDNGHGLSEEITEKGISHYEAFFSIGKTTKVKGSGIGYKCQGAKLCFASSELVILSKSEKSDEWLYFKLDNPRDNLNENTDLTPARIKDINIKLDEVFSRADQRTKLIVSNIKEQANVKSYKSGTIIIAKNVDSHNYTKYFTSDSSDIESSYIYNYIRFYTKHGDVRIIKEEHGFKADHKTQLDGLTAPFKNVVLNLWDGSSMVCVPNGYPYLSITEESEIPSTPLNLSQLRHGRFYCRHAKVIPFQSNKYSFILAVDGNRRALEKYSHLDRSGGPRSGIRLTDQRGTYLSTMGIKTCHYNQLWDSPELSEYSVLRENNAQSHFLFLIDGPFDLVTNRNSISSDSSVVLKSPSFIEQVKKFLDAAKNNNPIFKELVSRLNREKASDKRSAEEEALLETKRSLKTREKFKVNNIEPFKDKWFIAPDSSDEHWVGVLYTLFTHFVKDDSKYKSLWLMPYTFSARGIDSVGVEYGEKTYGEDKLRAIEYKNMFNPRETINHPLSLMKYIVCWDFHELGDGSQKIDDDFDCYGKIQSDSTFPECCYEIVDVLSNEGESFSERVLVISLKKLISLTFDVKFYS
ncbi:sensor histidine kinase [Aeromonas jandaei]|uniref:Sensor histidine kinase n=1 Tax=Aeromonas jandaei TaxID=650 RepID=A0ABD7ELU6_AERJA|nr:MULTISPECIES: ATP-binding protein [Aeromonas]QWL61626.1 sensor histidine kinase [Aeromonas jandaei]